MRVLQVHNRHEDVGGADAVITAERDQLVGAGHEVHQLLYGPASQTGLSSVKMGMAAVWNTEAVRLVDQTVASFAPDVMHVHTPFPLLSPAIFRAASDTPKVTTAHSFRYSCIAGTCQRAGVPCEDCVGTTLKLPGLRHRCYHTSLAGSLVLTASLVGHRAVGTFDRHVDRFITLTDFARGLLVRDGIPAEKVTVKPNAVPDQGQPVAAVGREPYGLFVGRLVAEKGVATLLEAWQGVDLDLKVAGDGPLRGEVERAAASNPRISVLGWLPESEVLALQARATVTVVPSEWYEAGPPLVLLQALASGTPVIASDLENICSTLVEHVAGWTFTTRSPASLRKTVRLAAAGFGSTEWSSRSTKARELYLRDHTPTASLDALESVYDDVLVARARARSRSAGRP
jgi:glycosyltransferase involved in cell wall biosynthesis